MLMLLLVISGSYFYFKNYIKSLEENMIVSSLIFQNIPPIPVTLTSAIFNKYKYLNRCLDSIKKQTFQNIEIILVDDGSTDESLSFITEEMKKDTRITLIQHTYNQGTLSSRNHAILSSNGRYIMSIDPDDEFFNSSSIELVYQNAVKYDADVLDFEFLLVTKTKIVYPSCPISFYDNKYLLDKLQEFNYKNTNWNLVKRILKLLFIKKLLTFSFHMFQINVFVSLKIFFTQVQFFCL